MTSKLHALNTKHIYALKKWHLQQEAPSPFAGELKK
jgi:hypothetical protein